MGIKVLRYSQTGAMNVLCKNGMEMQCAFLPFLKKSLKVIESSSGLQGRHRKTTPHFSIAEASQNNDKINAREILKNKLALVY